MAAAIRIWAIGGVLLVLAKAVVGLMPLVTEALGAPLSTGLWLATGAWVAFMIYAEAYRGFHLRFNPCVVARAHWLAENRRPWLVLIAPFFAMGLLYGSKRRLITSWVITIGVVILVILVGTLDQPYRGIIDLGVVIGLGLGGASLLGHAYRAERHGTTVDPQLPPDPHGG